MRRDRDSGLRTANSENLNNINYINQISHGHSHLQPTTHTGPGGNSNTDQNINESEISELSDYSTVDHTQPSYFAWLGQGINFNK